MKNTVGGKCDEQYGRRIGGKGEAQKDERRLEWKGKAQLNRKEKTSKTMCRDEF